MFLRPNYRAKHGKNHIYWSLVETLRTVDGPRAEDAVLLGGVERIGPGTVPEKRGGVQRARRRRAAKTVSWRLRSAWYPSTALDDLLEIEEGRINDTGLYRCWTGFCRTRRSGADPKRRYEELFQSRVDVLLYDLTST
jgi:hypothetical protein